MTQKIACSLALLFIAYSCSRDIPEVTILKPIINKSINDSLIVKNPSFNKGDVRRYGIMPNTSVNHLLLDSLLKFSSKGLPLFFPKGYYPINLNLNGLSNISIYFDNAIFGGGLNITNNGDVLGSKLFFDGNLIVLDKIFIRQSENISFTNVTVESDTLKNIYKKQNRGVSIYAGSSNIHFETLKIKNTGGDSLAFYKYSAAALQIHGWNNNPENLIIDQLEILSAARTALYITGNNHKIGNIKIHNFGLGSNTNLSGLEDAKPKEEKDFTGVWMNKCNNCTIDSLSISSDYNLSIFSLNLDYGVYSEPSFIQNLELLKEAKSMPIKDNLLTNILVKNTY